ncbi:MAG: phytanoyl-CoA dioxygenase family protein [Acidimicrobiales bacterium]|nr:phytanoyl-CoA dioxygenase family protein [Acidimicrobiales bacterium]
MRTLTPAELADHTARIGEQGYTIVPDAIEPDLVEEIDRELHRLEGELGTLPATNDFEGSQTVRIYNLLVHGRPFERIPTHPNVLPVVESVLDDGCLISSLSSIAICAGETPQPIHADDQLMPIPKPHPPTVCNTMWAITDFTEANGATRVIPGSHLADASPDYGTHYDSIPADMERGSVLVWHGSLWHGGGANTTDQRRIGVAMNYCAGYIRQQENQQLGIPREIAAGFTERLQRLCGYSVYYGLIGHIDKRDPIELLRGERPHGMVWDGL